ncbi:MAG: pyridoxal-phosphate dependent enzyme [Candidatus Heimdallarchaeaceae archaeon]
MWKKKPYCIKCKKDTLSINFDLLCPFCGSIQNIDPIQGPEKSKIKISNIWSFSSFLPSLEKVYTLSEGNTPILLINNISSLKGLKLKLEFRNPTGSFRDRASSLIASYLSSSSISKLVCSSSGSLGISLSAYSALAGLELTNIVPSNLELSKIEQMKVYGSKVVEHGSTTEEAIEKGRELQKGGVFFASSDNILTVEGQKTIGLEIAHLSETIENIIIPKGSGSLFYSIYRGFEDALASGWIEKIPSFYAVSLKQEDLDFFAESLKIPTPQTLSQKIGDILLKTKGKEIEIEGEKMIDQALLLAKKEGLFIEPASASVVVAANQLLENEGINVDSTVALLSGSGLNALNIFASKLRGIKKAVWGLSEKSTTKFEILDLISRKKANHGYAIWKALGKRKSLQSIYQHLNELEEKNLISSKIKGKNKKYYSITRKGIDAYSKMRELIDFL